MFKFILLIFMLIITPSFSFAHLGNGTNFNFTGVEQTDTNTIINFEVFNTSESNEDIVFFGNGKRIMATKGGIQYFQPQFHYPPYLLDDNLNKYSSDGEFISGDISNYFYDPYEDVYGGLSTFKYKLPPMIKATGQITFPKVSNSRHLTLIIPGIAGWTSDLKVSNISLPIPEYVPPTELDSNKVGGKVAEVISTGGYTYCSLPESTRGEIWLVTPNSNIKVGDYVEFDYIEPIRDYQSQRLNRTIAEAYFRGEVKVNGSFNNTATPDAPKLQSKISKIDFKNLTYKLKACNYNYKIGSKVKTVNGTYKNKNGELTIGDILYGDINGDNVEEAVVKIGCEPSHNNNSFSSEYHIFKLSNKKPVEMGTIDDEDGRCQGSCRLCLDC